MTFESGLFWLFFTFTISSAALIKAILSLKFLPHFIVYAPSCIFLLHRNGNDAVDTWLLAFHLSHPNLFHRGLNVLSLVQPWPAFQNTVSHTVSLPPPKSETILPGYFSCLEKRIVSVWNYILQTRMCYSPSQGFAALSLFSSSEGIVYNLSANVLKLRVRSVRECQNLTGSFRSVGAV